MTPLTLVRRFPIISFVVLACLIGWKSFIIAFLTGDGGSGVENLPIGPFFAALVVVACQGRLELRTWGRRIRDWRASPWWYLLAVLAPLALVVLIVLVNHGLGAPLPTSGQLGEWPQVPVNFLVMLVFVGIGEEAGWMAFAAPILLRRHGVLVAWVLSAGIRIFWHLPMMLTGDLSWTLGLLGNAAFSMVALLLLMASDGRWFLVGVWHASLNAASGLFVFTMVSGDDNARLGLLLSLEYTVVAVLAYFVGGRHLNLREDPPPLPESRENTSSAGTAPSEAAVTGAVARRSGIGGRHGA